MVVNDFLLICWVWRCTQTRACVCLLVREGEGIGIENPDLELSNYRLWKVSKGAKIRNRYNQVPHLTQDTNGKVTNSQ